MTCNYCGKEIATLSEFHSPTWCRACFNSYHKVYQHNYYRDNYSTADTGRLYNKRIKEER